MSAIPVVFEHGVFRPTVPGSEGIRTVPGSAVRHDLSEFEAMSDGEQAAALDGVYALLGRRFRSGESDTAARIDEHQP